MYLKTGSVGLAERRCSGMLIILTPLPSLGLTSHAVIKNWNAATTVSALGSVTALSPSDKESLANDSSAVSGKPSAWLPAADSKRQLLNV